MKSQKRTAEETYQDAHFTAHSQLEQIKNLLFDMPAPGSDEYKIDWGNVGDIHHINNQLSDLIAFLDGSNR